MTPDDNYLGLKFLAVDLIAIFDIGRLVGALLTGVGLYPRGDDLAVDKRPRPASPRSGQLVTAIKEYR